MKGNSKQTPPKTAMAEFMTVSPPRRAPASIGVSKNVPAGSEGTNSGPGRKGQG